jgi:type II secretory pathway component PulF
MPYKYRAYTSDKKIVEGTVDVATEALAEGALYRAGFEHVLSLKAATPDLSLEAVLPSLFGVRSRDLIDFSGELATLVESGISILTALELLRGQSGKKSLKKTVAGLVEAIQGGESLSGGMDHQPRAFPETYRRVIRASEQAGNLEVGLRQAAGYIEKQDIARQKAIRALSYPVFVLLMAAGVSVLLITVALPPLVRLFDSLGSQLPWTTELLIGVTGFVLDQRFAIFGGVITIILAAVFLLRLPGVRLARDRAVLRIPVVRSIIVERGMQQFCQTASMLLRAGLNLPVVMDVAIQGNRNRVVRRAFEYVRDRLLQGEGLSRPMGQAGVFPPLLVEMVVVGEKTGALDNTLATLADYYEKKSDRTIDTLVSLIEPLLTLVVGAVVIFIALSMITPLYSILRSMN